MPKTLLFLSLTFSLLFSQEDAFKNGKHIYEKACISCHAEDGNAQTNMKLVVKPRKLTQTILTQEQTFQIIKYGSHHWGAHSEMMPAFQTVFREKEIFWLSVYISKAFNPNQKERLQKLLLESESLDKKQEESTLHVGENIFLKKCAKCHGITGNGESPFVEASKDSEDFIYPYDLSKTLLTQEQIFLYAKYGGKYWGAYEDDMPAWGQKYNDEKLKSVAKYLHEKIKNSL